MGNLCNKINLNTTQTNRNASEDVKLFSGALAKKNSPINNIKITNTYSIQTVFTTHQLNNEVKVAHYTPTIFPLVPIVNDKTYRICNESWKYIINKKCNENTSGISIFYNDFYKRLSSINDGNKIITFIENRSKGKNKIAEKGNIIIRIIKFVLDKENHTESKLQTLGKIYKKFNLDPYFYSIFIETLIYTISSNLDYKATHEVMTEWINLFAFIIKRILK